jgi:hypothetical protein
VQKRTRSILTELDELLTHKDKDNLLESRANNIINGAINLINHIRENYDVETATKLENRLLNAIKGQDPAKFARGIRKIQNED